MKKMIFTLTASLTLFIGFSAMATEVPLCLPGRPCTKLPQPPHHFMCPETADCFQPTRPHSGVSAERRLRSFAPGNSIDSLQGGMMPL